MKTYYKDCKNIKQANSFLEKLNLSDFALDQELFDYENKEFDFDGWTNAEETIGVSVLVTLGYEVYITKYTKRDV